MGSYCCIHDEKDDYIYYAYYKFFGYIDDDYIKSLPSFKFLVSKNQDLEFILNISYIGTVIELTPKEIIKFMILYANDSGYTFSEMWGVYLSDLKIDNCCFISFD